ncbi:GNAT family N-acetyltransferase [Kutzneria kofuensis]|uniref:RimJ/RimL family protein N-acetyltransferase n=1 Tax=Kutzneria kofuensis TaxID=103725 RepID=A0A7W9KKI0_9PSEU|nr:GNAT family N-acetyltransferase [Kutzneria kofuensis]MBB5894224.1 RimJ/RimL family protein N-acetyltransferase [Kutzneria kofuensis]
MTSSPVEPLTTQRLSLHRVTMDDLDDFLALHAVESKPRSVEVITKLLQDFCAVWDAGEHGYWRIVLGDRTAGYGGVKPKTWRGRKVWNLYYRIWPELQGKGVATEMARKAISVATQLHPDWPVLVETRPDNVPSIRLAESVGMTRHPDADGWAVFLLEN